MLDTINNLLQIIAAVFDYCYHCFYLASANVEVVSVCFVWMAWPVLLFVIQVKS